MKAHLEEAQKRALSDEEISEIVRGICEANYDEAETDYWLEVLEKETGLSNISDYIFWPNLIGLALNATKEEIIEKIFEDRKPISLV